MISFREFKERLVEYIDTSGTQDINIPEIKNELNRHLSLVLRQPFVTVEQAIHRITKLLALYSLNLPPVDSDDKPSGNLNLVVGNNETKWDEFDGKIKNTNPWILNFTYSLNDGLYDCSAKIS